jgi:hypothetical protein
VSQSSPITALAEGQITPSPHDVVTVELVTPDGMPPTVRISWPLQPTVCSPRRYTEVAATVMRLLANASTELARRRARGRRPKLDL